MKLFLVDDSPVLRCGIRHVLASDPVCQVSGEAGSVAEAFQLLRGKAIEFDVSILDIHLPDHGGFAVLDELIGRQPARPVLIFSELRDKFLAVKALKCGAAGFIEKTASAADLKNAVRSVGAGNKFICQSLAEWLAFDASGQRGELPHERLSEREYQVFCLLSAGKAISEIAESMSRSPTTISTYRSRILRKMGLSTNAGLTQYALQHALIR